MHGRPRPSPDVLWTTQRHPSAYICAVYQIGSQFKTAWWEKLNIVGGQFFTDRPIRNIMYPSYPHDESHPNNQNSNCMIVAYDGMHDSQRLGSLMKGKDSPEEGDLLDLIMRDLAAVHKVESKCSGINLRIIIRGTFPLMSSNLVTILSLCYSY